jgi:hypothetical protein
MVSYLGGLMSIRRVAPAAIAALVLVLLLAASAAAAPIGAYTTKGAWSFASNGALHPPKLSTQGRTVTSQLAKGNFLVDNFPNLAAGGVMTGQGGPLILDNRLQPVWFRPVATNVVSGDLQQEELNGKPVLVYWQGVITHTGATSSGQVNVVDQRYRNIATVKGQGGWTISIHDAVIDGTNMFVTVYRNVANQNLAPYGGPSKGTVYDAGVQEFSLADPSHPTLVNTWDALNPGGTPNIPLSDSQQPASKAASTGPGGSWDAYHINAIEVLPNGQMLVTMRNTWAAYLVDVASGRTVWTLGG